ncbi:MAG: GTP cyclohydrolase I FolE2 [Ottowia sp.]|nr:GTP cyclohydrolase I FolE2 [Ottowia sp.]
MNININLNMIPDIQSSADHRQIPIQRVGVRSVRHPINVKTASGVQPSVGVYDLDVLLPAEKKGTHMSRFVALLEEEKEALSLDSFRVLLSTMLRKLDAQAGSITVRFPYFIKKTAPISGVQSLLDYQVTLRGELAYASTQENAEKKARIWLKVEVPVTSLCPCSKEISKYGAHNQRSCITIDAELMEEMSVDELVRIAEEEASCQLWGLLKRPDEQYVTERAYENPKFVEDLVRDVALRLNAEPRIGAYVLEAENFESIHNHNAYAQIQKQINSN